MTYIQFKNILPFFWIFCFISYLLYGTGIHSDDYAEIQSMSGLSLHEFYYASPEDLGIFLFGLPTYYILFWIFPSLGYENLFLYDVIKICINFFCFIAIYIFFKDYLSKVAAILCSFLFIFFPLHDATNYWYMCMGYLLSPAFLMLGHYLIRANKTLVGFLVTLTGAFAFYVSPPFIFGLGTIFLVEKMYKKFFIYITPGLIYCTYYFLIKAFVTGAERRIDSTLSISQFFKNLGLQIFSLLDASLGPSALLKIFYFLQSSGLILFILISTISFLIYKKSTFNNYGVKNSLNKSLLIGLIMIVILSLGMYSLTGYYWHTPFNLSNRSLIFVSLVLAYLVTLLITQKKTYFIFGITLIIILNLSISNHWKDWNRNQVEIVNNISINSSLYDIPEASTLFIQENLYSKIKNFSYIEFFIMPWTTRAIFSRLNIPDLTVISLSPYLELENNLLKDKKWNEVHILNFSENFYVYNSSTNTVIKISPNELEAFLNVKNIQRHWVQYFTGTQIQTWIEYLSPNTKYLFGEIS
jgi:hypothetical protein